MRAAAKGVAFTVSFACAWSVLAAGYDSGTVPFAPGASNTISSTEGPVMGCPPCLATGRLMPIVCPVVVVAVSPCQPTHSIVCPWRISQPVPASLALSTSIVPPLTNCSASLRPRFATSNTSAPESFDASTGRRIITFVR